MIHAKTLSAYPYVSFCIIRRHNAYVGVPWSGTIATFTDDASLGNGLSAAANYSNGSTSFSSTPVIAGGGGNWTVSDSQTFTAGGDFDAHTTISDQLGRSASADSYVNVSLPAFSVSASSPSVTEGQGQNNVAIATLSDGAGAYSVASSFDAEFVLGSQTYGVTLVPNSPNDGNYSLTVDLPGLPPNGPTGTLYVDQYEGGESNDVSTGVSINVASYNTLAVTEQIASIQYRQMGPTTVAGYSDSLSFSGNADPSSYGGTLTLNGQTYPISFAGGEVQANDLSSLVPGTYAGTLVVSDASAGQSSCDVSVDVADAPPSTPVVESIGATEGTQWSGQVATFTTDNQNVLAGDYTATINYGDGTTQTGTIGGGGGSFTVSDSHDFTVVDVLTVSVTIAEVAGSDPASATGAGSALVAPAAPTGLAVVENDANQVGLSWTNNSDGASDFYIERLDPGSDSYAIIDDVPAVPGVNAYSDFSVQPNSDGSGNAYSYLVLAATPDGNVSTMSNVVTATTPTAGVVSLDAAEISTTEIDLSWTLNDANATEVDVYRWTDGTAPMQVSGAPLDASTTPFADTGLTPDTHYYYKVCAVDPSGTTGYSVVDAYTLPNAATNLNATLDSGGTTVTLTWTDNSGSGTSFVIEIYDTGTGAYDVLDATGPGATSYDGLGAIDGANSQYEVVAESGDDGGGTPAATPATLSLPLAVPTNLVATELGSGEIALTWDDNSVTATSYSILRSSSSTGEFNEVGLVNVADGTYFDDTNSADLYGVQPGTAYYYQVQAVGPLSLSDVSYTASATTDPTFSVSGSTSAWAGTTYTLNRTVNYDTTGPDPVTGWNIDWGDGNTDSINGDPSQFTHTYTGAPGSNYVIAATPQTANGLVDDVAFQDVTIAIPSPTLRLIQSGTSGTSVTLVPTFGANGATMAAGYLVDWGDGDEQSYGPDAATFTHTYPSNIFLFPISGSYDPTLPVTTSYAVTAAAFTSVGVVAATIPAFLSGMPEVYPLWIGSGISDIDNPVVDAATGNGVRMGYPANKTFTWYPPYVDWPAWGYTSLYGAFTSTYDWGDGTQETHDVTYDTRVESETHTYATDGRYLATISFPAAQGTDPSGEWVNVPAPTPTLDPIADQTAAAGQGVTVTATFSGLDADQISPGDGGGGSGSSQPLLAFVDWGDGRGPQPATLTMTGQCTGTVSAHLDSVPAGGLSGTLYLYDEHGNESGQYFKVLCPTAADNVMLKVGAPQDDTVFTPIFLHVPADFDPTNATFTLTYSASDPNSDTFTHSSAGGDPWTFTAAPGNFALWTLDGSGDLNVADLNDGGNFINSGVAYPFSALPAANQIDSQTWGFYIETVDASISAAAGAFSVSVSDSNGNVLTATSTQPALPDSTPLPAPPSSGSDAPPVALSTDNIATISAQSYAYAKQQVAAEAAFQSLGGNWLAIEDAYLENTQFAQEVNQFAPAAESRFDGLATVAEYSLDSFVNPTGTALPSTDPTPLCFAKGTLVAMADGGRKAIETIVADEDVLAVPENDAMASPRACRVNAVYHNSPAGIFLVKAAGQTIRCTAGHPFYVRYKGWIHAKQLAAGDRLRTDGGEWVSVESVEDSGSDEPVFNLQVASCHTYFVAAGAAEVAILVHNDSASDAADFPAEEAALQQAQELAWMQETYGPGGWNVAITPTGFGAVQKATGRQMFFDSSGNETSYYGLHRAWKIVKFPDGSVVRVHFDPNTGVELKKNGREELVPSAEMQKLLKDPYFGAYAEQVQFDAARLNQVYKLAEEVRNGLDIFVRAASGGAGVVMIDFPEALTGESMTQPGEQVAGFDRVMDGAPIALFGAGKLLTIFKNVAKGGKFEREVIPYVPKGVKQLIRSEIVYKGKTILRATIPDVFIAKTVSKAGKVTGGALIEIKNWPWTPVHLSRQFLAQIAYAKETGFKYRLIVSPNTRLTDALYHAIMEIDGTIETFNRTTKTFSPYKF